jgi:hypothetical protein
MIDDMTNGTNAICTNQGRQGTWFTVKGSLASTTITPVENTTFNAWPLGADTRGGRTYGMRLAGTGFAGTSSANAFAILATTLTTPNGAYDASGFTGVSFYAKSKAGPTTIRVNFETTETRDTMQGGDCVEPNCDDHFGQYVALTATWQQYSIAFQYTTQEGWGQVAQPNFAHLWNIDFVYTAMANGATNPGNFEFLLSDLAFF